MLHVSGPISCVHAVPVCIYDPITSVSAIVFVFVGAPRAGNASTITRLKSGAELGGVLCDTGEGTKPGKRLRHGEL